MATEYRALLECRTNPCSYGHPGTVFPVEHPDGSFDTEDAARKHGLDMAIKVWGSDHKVHVESREVSEWQETR